MKFLTLLVAGLVAVGALACSDDADDAEDIDVTPVESVTTGSISGTVIAVEETEYSIQANSNTAQQGELTFALTNDGQQAHQFIVMRTDLAADALPLNENTGQVDIESEQVDVIVAQEAYEPGPGPNLAAELEPGHYVFICNLTGHYERGMRYDFVVAEGGGGQPSASPSPAEGGGANGTPEQSGTPPSTPPSGTGAGGTPPAGTTPSGSSQ